MNILFQSQNGLILVSSPPLGHVALLVFQSQNGLILVLELKKNAWFGYFISIPKWSDFSPLHVPYFTSIYDTFQSQNGLILV